VKNLHFRKGGDVQCIVVGNNSLFSIFLLETYRKKSAKKNCYREGKTILLATKGNA
jgi:hypothetical protein